MDDGPVEEIEIEAELVTTFGHLCMSGRSSDGKAQVRSARMLGPESPARPPRRRTRSPA